MATSDLHMVPPASQDRSQSVSFARGKMWFCSSRSWVADNLLHNLIQRGKGGELWEARDGRAPWLCSSFWNPTTLQLRPHPCVVSLPMSLGSAEAPTAHFCKNHFVPSNLVVPPSWREHQLQLNSSPLRAEPHQELLAARLHLWIVSVLLRSHLFHLFWLTYL